VTEAVYVETGSKRVFAGAIEWPGWCRSAKTDDTAIEALLAYAPDTRRSWRGGGSGSSRRRAPARVRVRERLEGDATTDVGAPAIAPRADRRSFEGRDAERQIAILDACWRAFDRAAAAAEGRELAKGPRGGGRDVDTIVVHVAEAESGYLSPLGARTPKDGDPRPTIVRVLRPCARRTARTGPEERKLWTPRYFVRRTAWHALDHAWEIEDRLQPKA